jgi:hypothetical protein
MRLRTQLASATVAVMCLVLVGSARGASVLVVADDGMGSASDCNDATPAYTSINAAIVAAAPGDTIRVCPGTYVENVVLNKSVHLIGAMAGVPACGRAGAETIIRAAMVNLPVLDINATAAAGAVVDGFTFDSDGGNPFACVFQELAANTNGLQFLNNRLVNFQNSGLYFNRSCVDCVISGNDIDGSGTNASGSNLFFSTNSYNGVQILDNCIHNSHLYGWFVDGNRNVDVGASAPLLSGNTFSNNVVGINSGKRSLQSATISDNVFQGNSDTGWQGGPKDCSITGNLFSGNGRTGLAFTSFGDTDPLKGAQGNSVTNNKFFGNGFALSGEAVFLSAGQAPGTMGTNVFHNNVIQGNRVGMTFNTQADTINAENNWWGSASGPSDPVGTNVADTNACPSVPLINSSGTGDSIAGTAPNVDYCPWTTSLPGATLVTAQTCYHVGDHVVVLINKSITPAAAAGGQFFLSFDAAHLSYNGGLPGDGSNVYDFEILDSVPAADQIDYAVGVTPGGSGTTAAATMARLDFTATANICAGSGLVAFRAHNPPTRLTDDAADEIAGTYFDLGPISVDSVSPSIMCPSDVSVSWDAPKDPPATGVATAGDNCGTPVVTYSDDRSGLTACGFLGGRGTIARTWTATDCAGNTASCVQTITVTDTTAPVLTACPSDVTTNADAGACTAVVTYTAPTAYDQQFFEGFEDAGFQAGEPQIGSLGAYSTDWNRYNSLGFQRVASGTDGVTSKSGVAHARIDSTTIPSAPDDYTGAFCRLGGYSGSFGSGFVASQDVYINLADPAVAANTYGFDLDTAASTNTGGFLRDFIFHAASNASGEVLIGGSNNTNFTRRNDLATINHYTITATGWYTFEWNFRDNGGFLSCDLNLRDASGTLLWTEVRNTTDAIAGVGGNRYMWFTFLEVATLHIDNTSLRRPLPVACVLPSGSAFGTGLNVVTCSATDACGNIGTCNFNVTVNPSNTVIATVKESGLGGSSTRGVTFTFYTAASCPGPAFTTCQDVAFSGDTGTVSFDVPCGTAWTGVAATDAKHTLRRTTTLGTMGVAYTADFTGAKALEQGNVNNDAYIDILDFGGFTGQFGAVYPNADTPCGTLGFRPDFSGNANVGIEDFTFIQTGFLHFRDVDPCGAGLAGDAPVTDISVDDLVASGLRIYAMADYNLDGRLNAGDIAWVARHGLPRCIADFNDDQAIDADDIFAYLNAWFMAHPKADLNDNGRTEVQDIFDFINAWFQGC